MSDGFKSNNDVRSSNGALCTPNVFVPTNMSEFNYLFYLKLKLVGVFPLIFSTLIQIYPEIADISRNVLLIVLCREPRPLQKHITCL